MPSAAELRDGDLLLRPWTSEDAEAVRLTPASPEIGRYFGVPFDGFPEPDPDAPWFTIVERGVPVGRIWCAGWKRPFEVGYFLRPDSGFRPDGEIAEYALFKDGTTRALRFVVEGV